LDDGREEKSPNGFGSWDQTVLLFRTASLELQGAVWTRAEVLSGCVSAGKFMFPQNVFDPIADRVLSHESEQSLWMLTPNCNFQF
jgi:hypothetical protein